MLQRCNYVARVFHISTLSVLSGLRVTRTATTERQFRPNQWTGNPKATCSNSARGQFFAMLISCSRCSDGSMWLPFW